MDWFSGKSTGNLHNWCRLTMLSCRFDGTGSSYVCGSTSPSDQPQNGGPRAGAPVSESEACDPEVVSVWNADDGYPKLKGSWKLTEWLIPDY